MSSLPALAIWLEIYQMERCSGRLHWQVGYSVDRNCISQGNSWKLAYLLKDLCIFFWGGCFIPTALPIPGSPLRPSGSASGFSGPCRSTCWCKTGRNCISQLQAGLPCEEDLCIFLCRGYCNVNFGMVEACLPLPAETRNCGAHRIKLKSPDWKSWRVEISHVESEAGWNKNLHKAENFHSVPASLVIWSLGSQATRSWRVFESGLCLILSESWLLPFTGWKSMVGTVVG